MNSLVRVTVYTIKAIIYRKHEHNKAKVLSITNLLDINNIKGLVDFEILKKESINIDRFKVCDNCESMNIETHVELDKEFVKCNSCGIKSSREI